MESTIYRSPRELRTALRAAGGDWAQVLTPAQFDTPLWAEAHGGHGTLRSWLADGPGVYGATERECAHVWACLHQEICREKPSSWPRPAIAEGAKNL